MRRINDLIGTVILAAFNAAMRVRRVPVNFEQLRRWRDGT